MFFFPENSERGSFYLVRCCGFFAVWSSNNATQNNTIIFLEFAHSRCKAMGWKITFKTSLFFWYSFFSLKKKWHWRRNHWFPPDSLPEASGIAPGRSSLTPRVPWAAWKITDSLIGLYDPEHERSERFTGCFLIEKFNVQSFMWWDFLFIFYRKKRIKIFHSIIDILRHHVFLCSKPMNGVTQK